MPRRTHCLSTQRRANAGYGGGAGGRARASEMRAEDVREWSLQSGKKQTMKVTRCS